MLVVFGEIFLENHGLTILDPTKATTGHGWQGPQRYPKIQTVSFKEFFFEISLHLGFWSFEFRFWILALRGWILDGR